MWLSVFATACSRDAVHGRCTANSDCAVGFECDASSGSCHCTTDAACGVDEFCNGYSCQKHVACDSTYDCPKGSICDTKTGNCIDPSHCTADVQCPMGQICDTTSFECVPGCHDESDCLLGQVCRCGTNSTCALGECVGDTCNTDSNCHFGERCIPDLNDVKGCVKDTRGPYCGGCAYEPGQVTHCGDDAANFCLLDRKVNYFHTYCGVDCSAGQACPWGYMCRDILILTHSLCTADTDCPAHGGACETDRDCPQARCDPATKKCAGKCSFNEDSKKGFCTCVADSECPADQCDTTTRLCAISKKPCTPDGLECGHTIYCVNTSTRAACFIGRNCVPALGYTCDMLLGSP